MAFFLFLNCVNGLPDLDQNEPNKTPDDDGTWMELKGEYFDKVHFSDCLARFPLKGEGCYLFLIKANVDIDFPTLVITQMEKLPFIPDPGSEDDKDRQYRLIKI